MSDTQATVAPPGGLREHKKRRTRQALQYAALTLVAERGLDGVTTDEIAAAADVSARTFFNYFPNKDAALAGTDPQLPATLGAQLLGRPAAEAPLDALRAVVMARVASLTEDRELWRLRRRVIKENPRLLGVLVGANAETERALSEALGQRMGLDPGADPLPAMLVGVASVAGRTAMAHHASTGFVGSPERIVEQLFDRLKAQLPAAT